MKNPEDPRMLNGTRGSFFKSQREWRLLNSGKRMSNSSRCDGNYLNAGKLSFENGKLDYCDGF